MIILCYGDSNTWGYSPNGGFRFDADTRWPAVMAGCLGPDYKVIEEGLNGRTIGNFMSSGIPLNGLEYLDRLLPAYPDTDLIIIYLGINDLFQRNDIGAEEIARNIGYAVELIQSASRQQDPPPEVLLLSPLPVNLPEEDADMYRLQIIKSECFYNEYRKVAEQYGVKIFNTGSVISASTIDGVHIDAEEHRKLGKALCAFIREQYR